jgi:PAS domain S-box-containing protein
MSERLQTSNQFLFGPQLRRKGDFTLFHGVEARSQKKIIGVTVAAGCSASALQQLRHEFSLAGKLDSSWSARPVAFVHHEGREMLVLEDPGGEPLDWIIVKHANSVMDIGRFLRIAIDLTAALDQVHRQGIVHKDIKPANALVGRSGGVWLTGFGVASQLPRERQARKRPETIAGTLAYMSPEQTGRVSRNIDTRSDLYSLGITLYEVLTGVLPFEASDPMEWVHCQIARKPRPLEELRLNVPEPVAAIIMKLLAKAVEERFQTAAGLERDLRRCLQEWDARGQVDMFALAESDAPGQLFVPEGLYGRSSSRKALEASFARVAREGRPALILVSGSPGTGKSSIVREVFETYTPPRALFAAGKFDQYMGDVPYATLAESFRSLVDYVLSKDQSELRLWQEAFVSALGPNASLLAELIPGLELVMGKQPPVVGLSPKEAELRFQVVLRRFIAVFARPEHPLVLFLDDLQWSDAVTLDLLVDLLKQGAIPHLLLVGACRDNEVGGQKVVSTFESLRQAGASAEVIRLEPLGRRSIGRLVACALRSDLERTDQLVDIVMEKTGGNPLFAMQFLQSLEERALLVFNRAEQKWSWDAYGIRSESCSDNVVDLMVANLKRLPGKSLRILCRLACYGGPADVGLLAEICQTSPDKLLETLRQPVKVGMLVYSDDNLSFQHDRLREAAYLVLGDRERAEIHVHIGRLLLSRSMPQERDSVAFQIVNQFGRSLPSALSPDERTEVAQFNLIAGKRSKKATAYAAAVSYFTEGIALLSKDCWTLQYPLIFAFELNLGECEFLTGDLVGAEDRLSLLARRAANLVDQAAVTCLLIDLYIVLGQPETAFKVGLAFLEDAGFNLPLDPPDDRVREEYDKVWNKLGTRRIEDLINLPTMNDPKTGAAIEVLNRLVLSALYQGHRLHRTLIALMVNISMDHGNSAASCVAYVSFGRTLLVGFEDYSSALRFGKLGLDLVEKPGFEAYKSRVYFTFGTGISSWAQHLRLGRSVIEQALEEAQKNGDLAYIGYCHSNIIGNLLSSGAPLAEVDRAAVEGLKFARRSGSRIASAYIVGQLRLIRSLRGLPSDFEVFDGRMFDAEEFERALRELPNQIIVEDIYWTRRLQALVFQGDYALALEAAALPRTISLVPLPNIEGAEYHFYSALAHVGSLDLVQREANEQAGAHFEAVQAHHRRLLVWADNCPENFEGRASLIGAELARLEGNELEAELLYARAIQWSRLGGFLNIEALASEKAANFYSTRGLLDIAEMYLLRARSTYAKWGANGVLERLSAIHPEFAAATADDKAGMAPPSDQQLDVSAIFKASQALAGEMRLPQLVEKLMRIAVEHAGAGRGVLVLLQQGDWYLGAEAGVKGGKIVVAVRRSQVTSDDLARSILHLATRTRQRVLIHDAASSPLRLEDEYIRRGRSRSILCLPIVWQTEVTGALYLENDLVTGAFTKERVDVLEILASQAAVSLKNAALYTDLQRSETFLDQGQRTSRTGSFGWCLASGEFFWSEEFFNILEYDRSVIPSAERAIERVHPDEQRRFRALIESASRDGREFDSEHRLVMPDGRIKYVHTAGRVVRAENLDFVGSVRDVTDRVLAEERLREVQNELAHVARVNTLNALAASIAHEVSQPISGIITNANTGARLLKSSPPDIIGLSETIRRTIRDANRASDVITRLRAMFQKRPPVREMIDLNEAAQEVIALTKGQILMNGVTITANLAEDLPWISADRVQLQQVILNLLLNASEAMAELAQGPRTIRIRTYLSDKEMVRLDVQDTGIGVPEESFEKLFEAFYTTKTAGMGMGLSICRSIVESHGGRLWIEDSNRSGTTFSFSIPMMAL